MRICRANLSFDQRYDSHANDHVIAAWIAEPWVRLAGKACDWIAQL